MKNWWISRAPRERVILILAGIALLAMLYYLMVWEPLIKGSEKLAQQRNDAATLQSWLMSIEPEVSRLRKLSGNTGRSSKGSVLSIADSSAKAAGLGNAVKRMQPDGENMARAWLENASFNPLLAWLHKLETNSGIYVTDLNISRETQAGHVKARLTLKR